MIYDVRVTPQAQKQIIEVIAYVLDVFKDSVAADNLLKEINSSLNSLSEFPYRLQIVPNMDLGDNEIRRMNIKNFIAYFQINEIEKAIYVLAFVYARRDQKNVLIDIMNDL